MKKALCFMLLLFSMLSQAQKAKVPVTCATDDYLQKVIRDNPEIQERIDYINKEIRDISDGNLGKLTVQPVITIPVVVYVVHDPAVPATNISDAQVQSQLTALNTYFDPYSIRFCLATRAGTGTSIPGSGTQTTPGILHIANATLSENTMTGNLPQLVALANSAIIPERYMRIWVVKSINGPTSTVQGYASLAFANANFDGIVMKYNVFGNAADPTCNCNWLLPDYGLGKILVHEVGHYLGLYHTFEGGCSGMGAGDCATAGDRVCDTPPVAAPNYSCASGTNSCAETPNLPDNINNYMDYGNNNCANMFSNGQKDRMFAMLNTYKNELFSNENILYTGTCGSGSIVTASFVPTPYNPCAGASVSFHPMGGSLNYSWNFGDGSPVYNTTSNADFTHIFASASGSPYTVTLTVSDLAGTTSTVSTALIYVTACSATNNADTNWYYPTNNSLSFSTGVPVFNNNIPLGNAAVAASAIQNDASGNLLFYTNGTNVYNHLHAQINGATLGTGFSSPNNSVLIVPNPANANQYYIFRTMETGGGDDTYTYNGLRYSIVSMASGTATMVSTNVPVTQTGFGIPAGSGFIPSTVDGALTGGASVAASQNCNGYWIFTTLKKSPTNYLVVVFSLTSTGLTYQSEIALSTPGLFWQYNIKVAPNGNKVFVYQSSDAAANNLFDFNKAAGILSNNIAVAPALAVRGASFSPDSRVLYISESNTRKIAQYNINSANIPNTRIVVGSGPNGRNLGHIQLGPDNKLYMPINGTKELAVIHSPNILSNGSNANLCQFYQHGPVNPSTVPGNTHYSNLPNLINARTATAYFPANNANVISTYVTGCNQYKFFPNFCGTAFNWTFFNTTTGVTTGTSAATNPVYTFPSNGIYTITLRDAANTTVLGTTSVTITSVPTPVIVGSTTSCPTDTNYSQTNNSVNLPAGSTAQWSITGGAGVFAGPTNQPSVSINWTTLPGTISLAVTTANGCTATVTRAITATAALPTPTIAGDTYACLAMNPQTINTTPFVAGQTIQWSITGGAGNIISQSNDEEVTVNWTTLPGTLSLTVTNASGCAKTVTRTIAALCCYEDEPLITGDGWACTTPGNNTTTHSSTIPAGGTGLWTITGGTGTIVGPANQANVTVQWSGLNGWLTFTVTAANGCVTSSTAYIYDECACECLATYYFTATPNGKPNRVNFQALTSGPVCPGIKKYYWTFGDGTFLYSFNPAPVHTYPSSGTYSASLSVALIGEYDQPYCGGPVYTHDVVASSGLKMSATGLVPDENYISVYPNPASSDVNIDLEMPADGTVRVIVRSIDGKELSSHTNDLKAGAQTIGFRLPATLASGMVLVEISGNGFSTVKKLMVK